MKEIKVNDITLQYEIGDCLELMRDLEEQCVDLILTDPPYGVEENYGETYVDSFENWKKLITQFIPEALRISRGAVLISTSKLEGEIFLFKNFPLKWRICWYKGASVTRSPIGFKDWETIFVYGNVKKIQTHDFFTVHANMVRKKIPEHPCPKPFGWALWLISKFSNKGDTILDPFLGSGTTLLACRKTGRNGIGFEINPDYEPIIRKRIMADIKPVEGYKPIDNYEEGVLNG